MVNSAKCKTEVKQHNGDDMTLTLVYGTDAIFFSMREGKLMPVTMFQVSQLAAFASCWRYAIHDVHVRYDMLSPPSE